MPLSDALLARGLFDTSAAHASGATDSDLRAAVRRGTLSRIRRGWYTSRPTRWPLEKYQLDALVEAQLHPDQSPSHVTALVALGLPVHQPDLSLIHMRWRTEGRRQRRGKLHVHERLPVDGGCRYARAVMEAALHDAESALVAADAALHRGLTRPADLDAWAERLAFERGSAGVVLVHRLADGLRESPGESRSALSLHDLGYVTTRQVAVATSEGIFRLDGAIDGEWVGYEYDGREKYLDDPGALLREKRREDALRDAGWEIVRITYELLADPVRLRQLIEAARARARRRHGGAVRAA